MNRMRTTAPLPFQGQKRMFAKDFVAALKQFPDNAVFVDLFGGSGLLSHLTKRSKPAATVVYNDFDGYRFRLRNIPQTNKLLADIRILAGDTTREKRITGELRERILKRIEDEERLTGYVDFITVSSWLQFSGRYALSLRELSKVTLYNSIRKTDYPECPDYLQGIDVASCDYLELYNQYKDVPGVVFLADPPYLSTDCGTYNMTWGLSDYLGVLTLLERHSFVYFTSNKSQIIELCEWMGENGGVLNPLAGCEVRKMNAHPNYSSGYTDMMLFKNQDDSARSVAV